METTRVWVLGFRAQGLRGLYWRNKRIMEKKMETTRVCGYIGEV